jgi:hypothetical protein
MNKIITNLLLLAINNFQTNPILELFAFEDECFVVYFYLALLDQIEELGGEGMLAGLVQPGLGQATGMLVG